MNHVAETETAPVWHAGELTLQKKVGVEERMALVGSRAVRDYLPEQHRQFYPLLAYVVLGAVDKAGDAWATLRAGKPGFLHSDDPHHLQIANERDAADPADGGMDDGDALGLLGIDLKTRRRNRLNGTIGRSDGQSFALSTEQTFGNCPQYIQLRDFEFVRDPAEHSPYPPEYADTLDERARAIIRAAASFFVASYVDRDDGAKPTRQVDVSHRGGKPGFVRIDDDRTLTIPEFAGNLFFATLGNFFVNPKAGLVFADFDTGDLLQLTGDAEVVLDSPEIAAFAGAERMWRFHVRRAVYRRAALPLRWITQHDGMSPNARMTGSWDEAAMRLKASATANEWRPLRVKQIVDESTTIRSFHLEATGDTGLVPHAAGQHLPLRVTLPGSDKPVLRTYTLSVAPSDRVYRISVKRDGVVSRYLHDTLHVGDTIEARGPDGDFTIDPLEPRPAVLLAAGVGITPMLAMLRHVVHEGIRKRKIRPIWLFQAARALAERAFDKEIASLVQFAESAGGSVHVIRVLSQTDGAKEGQDYEVSGHIDIALLKEALPFDDYDFYLCGPSAFMQNLYDGLRGLNIADARIHAEAFGPASLRRTADAGAPAISTRQPAEAPVPVVFAKSGKETQWTPGAGTLLELAEASGLAPEFSCRGGSCGTCRTRVVEGAVAYPVPPAIHVAEGEALICCSVPAQADDGEPVRLRLDL
ncbi:MAG TPA: pyridoxamine 5'-phosphate oxidase family protein [Paraburkholderia sp.]|nr:pyridoxamine 5'-phosphate oxidase family protein [Paraburkholderia sp.]